MDLVYHRRDRFPICLLHAHWKGRALASLSIDHFASMLYLSYYLVDGASPQSPAETLVVCWPRLLLPLPRPSAASQFTVALPRDLPFSFWLFAYSSSLGEIPARGGNVSGKASTVQSFQGLVAANQSTLMPWRQLVTRHRAPKPRFGAASGQMAPWARLHRLSRRL